MNVDTIALWTPPGRAALATLGVQGPNVWRHLRELFLLPEGRRLPEAAYAGQVWFGKLGEEGLADDVVLGVKEAGETAILEIHCHGGPEVVHLLEELFVRRGVAAVSWLEQAKLRGGAITQLPRCGQEAAPPWRVEALEMLSRAPTVRTANILREQPAAWDQFLSQVTPLLAANDPAARDALQRALYWERFGKHLVEPWKVIVAGAPNVGKSSLVNAIAGYERSVVSPIPGTTRDVVGTTLAIDGWPVLLVDSAGLRPGGDELEQAGIALARQSLHEADLCLWLVDATTAPLWTDALPCPVVRVINKIDQPARWPLDREADALRLSALTGEGITSLCAAISEKLVPQVPPTTEAIPLGEGTAGWLRNSLGNL